MFIKKMRICGFMAFEDSEFQFRNGLAFHRVFGVQQECGKTSFIHAIRFVLDPSYQSVKMSEIRYAKSQSESQAYVQLWIGLEENEQAHFAMDLQNNNTPASLNVGSELVVLRLIDEKQQNFLHVFEYGTIDSYQQIQLAYFHRILYGNTVYSGMLDLDGFSDWILRDVLNCGLDTFFVDTIHDYEDELRVQDRRQKHIGDIARVEDEQEILKLLLQKINADKELTIQTAELRKIDKKKLSEQKNRQESLYLSAQLRANASESLYALHLSMLTFVELSKEEKNIFEISKHISDSQTVREDRIEYFESYLQKLKELYNCTLAAVKQNMAIYTYKASRAQDKAKEKNDLEVLIKMIERYKFEDEAEMDKLKKLITKLNSEIRSAKEQYQLLQNGFGELNEGQTRALENLECLQLKILKNKELRESAQLMQSAAINEIFYIHLGSAAGQVFRKEIIAGNIFFEQIIVDCDPAIYNDYRGQVIDFLKVKDGYQELIPHFQHSLSGILMTFVFGSTQQMHRMINLMQYSVTDIDIAFEFVAEDKIRKPNSLMPINELYCKPISYYFETVDNIAVQQLLDDYLVLNSNDEHDGAVLAKSNQRNVLCIQSNRIFYCNTTIKTIGKIFTPNEDDVFAERAPLIRARQLARDFTETVLSKSTTELNENLQTCVTKLKEAEKKMVKHRGSMIQMQYKLDELDRKNFVLQAGLERSEQRFLLNSEKLNGFQRILDGFLNGFGNDVRLKEANNKAHRNRYSSKSLIITCDIEIQDFQKKIERRTKMLTSMARQCKATFITPDFEEAWNKYEAAFSKQQIDQNKKMVNMYNREIAHVHANRMSHFTEMESRWQELSSKMDTVNRLEKSLAELQKEKRIFLKNFKEWAKHPLLLQRRDWTANQLNTRLAELRVQTGSHFRMRKSIDGEIKKLKASTQKCLNATKYLARIDRALVEPNAYAHFNCLKTIMTTANQFIQRLYYGRIIVMRLYLVLRDGECHLYDDYVTNMELRGPSAIVSLKFVMYEGQKILLDIRKNDEKIMAMCFYLATCLNNGIRPIVLLDDLSNLLENHQIDFLEILNSEPLLGRQHFCVTDRSYVRWEQVEL